MSLTYTDRVNNLKAIASYIGGDNGKKWNLILDNLRKSSDIMEIIGHPRNPSNLRIKDKSTEMFSTFKSSLSLVRQEILGNVESKANFDTACALAKILNNGKAKAVQVTDFLKENISLENQNELSMQK